MTPDEIKSKVERLLLARAKVLSRLKNPPAGKEDALKARLAEYDQTIKNWQDYGQPTPPSTAPVSVSIDVPKGTVTVEAREPGV